MLQFMLFVRSLPDKQLHNIFLLKVRRQSQRRNGMLGSKVTSAPFKIRNSVTAVWPFCAALCRGVKPYLSTAFTLAPFKMSVSTTSGALGMCFLAPIH
jgi:hypothetical protein